MKKILTLALVAAMLSATGITAFAETTNVSYDVQPTYTVTIPATVDLGDNDVTANIEASDVLLETSKQIKVDLTAASNTASGSTFNAKNGDSAVTYTITGDKAIAVGDTVATFTADGSKTLTFSAADKSGATVAGAHTETLTFTVSLADAAVAVTGVTLNKSSFELTKTFEATLTATVTPDDATDPTVTWTSSNESIATVDANGKVTGVGAGTATITATAGEKSASCAVKVIAEKDIFDIHCVAGQTWAEAIVDTDFRIESGKYVGKDVYDSDFGEWTFKSIYDSNINGFVNPNTVIDLTHEYSMD